ncbi:MAG: hypothetical protein K1W23_00915 [Lachnospiraceae bacterium]
MEQRKQDRAPSKAVLTIECSGGKEDTAGGQKQGSQNQAARRVLEQGAVSAAVQNAQTDPFDSGTEELTVQYNPASIRYHASVSENSSIKYENQGNVHDQITSVTGESSVDMSFSLVFHSRFPGDLSVRQQMERILKMIRQSPTRQVGFRWEGIQMVGRLVSFSGEYDMFDASGVPVSGHMDLTIETSAKLERTSRTIARLEESENRNV